MKKHWSVSLERMGACKDGVEWARTQPSLAVAWKACDRGDWMLWLAGRTCKRGSPTHRRVVLAACACARTVLRYIPKGENRPLEAIKTAEAWARRRPGVTLELVRDAAYATSSAADAAANAAYANAANASAYAAYAATYATYAAAYAAAANAAAYAAAAADADATDAARDALSPQAGGKVKQPDSQ